MEFKVLDTSVLLHATPDFTNGGYMLPNSVLQEVRQEDVKVLVEAALRDGSIQVIDPNEASINAVKRKARDTGDLSSLSNTDIDVLALAYEKNALLLSDDYAIQNTARKLEVKVKGMAQEGIRKDLTWIKICEGCRKQYSAEQEGKCPVCGSNLHKKSI